MNLDPRSTPELIAHAIVLDVEDEERWNLVRLLQRMATAEVFEAMVELCRSADPAARLLGGRRTRPARRRDAALLRTGAPRVGGAPR